MKQVRWASCTSLCDSLRGTGISRHTKTYNVRALCACLHQQLKCEGAVVLWSTPAVINKSTLIRSFFGLPSGTQFLLDCVLVPRHRCLFHLVCLAIYYRWAAVSYCPKVEYTVFILCLLLKIQVNLWVQQEMLFDPNAWICNLPPTWQHRMQPRRVILQPQQEVDSWQASELHK